MKRYIILGIIVVLLVGCAYACQELPPTEEPPTEPPVDEPPVDEPPEPVEPVEPVEPIEQSEPKTVGMQCTA
jgi:PBP1b-binding outer membrane lipoprotein LpoB